MKTMKPKKLREPAPRKDGEPKRFDSMQSASDFVKAHPEGDLMGLFLGVYHIANEKQAKRFKVSEPGYYLGRMDLRRFLEDVAPELCIVRDMENLL